MKEASFLLLAAERRKMVFSMHLEIELRRCPHLVFAVITSETHLWAMSDADEDARELRSSVSKLNPNHACES